MDLQTFFESGMGKLTIVAMIIICLILCMVLSNTKKGQKTDTKALTFSAIAIAITFILNNIVLFKMPQGGSVTLFSMLIISLVGYWFGLKTGITAGIAFGFLNMLIDPYIIHPVQALLDYPLAFGMLGLSGLFYKDFSFAGVMKGYCVGVFGRFICSFLSAVIFFGSFAPEGFNAVTWGIVYNGGFMAAEMLLTLIVLAIKPVQKAILQIKNSL